MNKGRQSGSAEVKLSHQQHMESVFLQPHDVKDVKLTRQRMQNTKSEGAW